MIRDLFANGVNVGDLTPPVIEILRVSPDAIVTHESPPCETFTRDAAPANGRRLAFDVLWYSPPCEPGHRKARGGR
jgi:hypothetical protein